MRIITSQENGRAPVTIFRIEGDIATESAEELQQQASDAFEAGARHLLLDLSKVSFISSSGLRAIHYIFLLFRSDSQEDDKVLRKGLMDGTYYSPRLKLLRPTRNVRQALTLAGYDLFLEIHTDLNQAIASF
ncbi:MAG TPA: STAS domain-containing protein [Anaerolineae bacterium]|nr:STAS domain-containing protein [Anaerolineae bacterium]